MHVQGNVLSRNTANESQYKHDNIMCICTLNSHRRWT